MPAAYLSYVHRPCVTHRGRAENVELAFRVAEQLGIARLLDVEDIVDNPKPEPFSIMTYLSQHYHYFTANKVLRLVGCMSPPHYFALAPSCCDRLHRSDLPLQGAAGLANIDADAAAGKRKAEEAPQAAAFPAAQVSPAVPALAGEEELEYCAKCGKELEGAVMEVLGKLYHQECFGCTDCGKPLTTKCLNVDNLPYCEQCGKKAFVQSKVRKTESKQQQAGSPMEGVTPTAATSTSGNATTGTTPA